MYRDALAGRMHPEQWDGFFRWLKFRHDWPVLSLILWAFVYRPRK